MESAADFSQRHLHEYCSKAACPQAADSSAQPKQIHTLQQHNSKLRAPKLLLRPSTQCEAAALAAAVP
jgi:hypothetical protein